MVASLRLRILVLGVDGLTECDIFLLVVTFEVTLGLNLRWRLGFGSFGPFGSWRLGRSGALWSDRQWSWVGGLLLFVLACPLSQVIVDLFETLMLVMELIDVCRGEEFVLGAKIFDEFPSEVNGSWEDRKSVV